MDFHKLADELEYRSTSFNNARPADDRTPGPPIGVPRPIGVLSCPLIGEQGPPSALSLTRRGLPREVLVISFLHQSNKSPDLIGRRCEKLCRKV
jgi:hypothetical protein